MIDLKNRDTCRRVARIWSKSQLVVVQCILEKKDHPDDWHKDAIHGVWDEVEELDERYSPDNEDTE